MIESEALKMWCPMKRTARREPIHPGARDPEIVIVGGLNTDALGSLSVPASCRCIAAQCMMWRQDFRDPNYSDRGFCGLAGTPLSINQWPHAR